jgi:hypothetical protein
MSADFVLKPQFFSAVVWSRRGSCGEPGCKDPECCCAFCREPIGVSEYDPRWEDHDDYCDDCDLCRDQVPIIMFRGEEKATEGAQFHLACFERIAFFRSRIASPAGGVR